MTRILLIRHGSTDLMGRVLYGRMPDVHINDLGKQQAQQLRNTLIARYSISEIIIESSRAGC